MTTMDNSDPDGAAADGVPVPAAPTWPRTQQSRSTLRGRFVGCLLGGAVGDALGAPVEFMSRAQILERFGELGLTDYAPAYGGLGRTTDDTQMTLFTAEGLLRGHVRAVLKGITSHTSTTAYAYLRWLRTQGESPHRACAADADTGGWLFQQPELHHSRAPGNTCLSALRETRHPGEPARNDSKGCGGLMRVAPAGLFTWTVRDLACASDALTLGSDLARLTHGHPTGHLTAGVLAVLIMGLCDGASLQEGLPAAISLLEAHSGHEETLAALQKAQALADTQIPAADAICQLGQGWVAEEALAISVYCALVAQSFEQGVLLAVNHDGDSDSTGAITGNLLGALHGLDAIPRHWIEKLELGDVITEVAEDLISFRDWPISSFESDDPEADAIFLKYPGY